MTIDGMYSGICPRAALFYLFYIYQYESDHSSVWPWKFVWPRWSVEYVREYSGSSTVCRETARRIVFQCKLCGYEDHERPDPLDMARHHFFRGPSTSSEAPDPLVRSEARAPGNCPRFQPGEHMHWQEWSLIADLIPLNPHSLLLRPSPLEEEAAREEEVAREEVAAAAAAELARTGGRLISNADFPQSQANEVEAEEQPPYTEYSDSASW